MAGQQSVLDPRLGVNAAFPPTPQYNEASQRAPPLQAYASAARADGSKGEASLYHSPPQPYYHYPSPQQTQTPLQSGGPSDSHSAQASPQGHYPPQADSAGSPEPGNGHDGDDPKRPRACEACRGLKVRCDQDPAHPDIPCKRCAKAGRQCVITQPSRKRQKKADSRVAELEKKLDALTAALHQQQGAGGQYSTPPQPSQQFDGRSSAANASQPYPPPPSHGRSASVDEMLPPSKRRRTEDAFAETPSFDGADEVNQHTLGRIKSESKPPPLTTPGNPNPDMKRYLSDQSPEEFVNRINHLISPDMAATVFNRYTTKLAPHLPAVVFPPGTTAEQMFNEKPILYVCILSAASRDTLHPDLSQQITKEAIGALADCVVRNGAKSLELIQAMQVTALWYKPPERPEQSNFYQIIHMAAVMALDIGLGKRFHPSKAKRTFGPSVHGPAHVRQPPQDSDTLEARRAWLGCYYLCASASMVLRRPNLVRWTNYMKECIEVLESHPDAYPSDKFFCQHVKIQHICEDIGLQFLMDDNTANISITDPKVTYALNVLETQLKAWKEQIPPECRTPGLQFFEHVTALYLHEIALHFNHNIEDFRLPFTEESLKSVNNTSDTLTQNQMSALEACLKAAHGVLDTMLSFDIQTVKTLPMLIYFVRCTYAIVILIKMHVAVCTPQSELGKMMKADDLRVEYYIDSLISLFSYVEKESEFKPHPKIMRILNVLRDWFMKHKENVAAQQRGDHPSAQQAQQQDGKESAQQTPLHLLSQVATGNQQMSSGGPSATEAQDWTFNTPNFLDYGRHRQVNPADGNMQQSQPGSQGVYPEGYAMAYGDGQGMIDPGNPEFGWGTNFEQAMDMALGMDAVHAHGLDNWFLGESVAPFGFNGDMAGNGQW